jgi:deoxyribonuclease-4
MLLGAHVPTAGGLARAPRHGQTIGASAIQIFTRNQVQWQARPVAQDEARAFREALDQSGVERVVAHASYLINLASPDPVLLEKSRAAFVAEMERCHLLGIGHIVFHPGAHMGAGEATGVATVAASLDAIDARTRGLRVAPTLEVTAGQGSYLGASFEQLAEIIGRVRRQGRLRVCLDTCHLHAAGYDLTTPRGLARTLDAFERTLGLGRLAAVHVNDARRERGSHVDRHAALGEGELGWAVFRRLVREPRLRKVRVPLILETPEREIAALRRHARRRT